MVKDGNPPTAGETSRRAMDEKRARAREETAAWEAREAARLAKLEWLRAVLVAAVCLVLLFLLQANHAAGSDREGAFGEAMLAAGIAVGLGTFCGFCTLFGMGWFLGVGGGTLGLDIVRLIALASFFVLCLLFAGPVAVIWTAIPAFAFSSVMCYWLFDFDMTEAGLLTGVSFVLSIVGFVILAFLFGG